MKKWLVAALLALPLSAATAEQPASTLSGAISSLDETQSRPSLRGIISVEIDRTPQIYLFVSSDGTVKAVAAMSCRTDVGCKALVDALEALHDVSHLNIKSVSA